MDHSRNAVLVPLSNPMFRWFFVLLRIAVGSVMANHIQSYSFATQQLNGVDPIAGARRVFKLTP